MDLVWLVIPAAVGLFVLRTVLMARQLKLSAQNPSAADRRALRNAQRALQDHRAQIADARAAPAKHLGEAKGFARLAGPRLRAPSTGVDAMVEDFLPERRS